VPAKGKKKRVEYKAQFETQGEESFLAWAGSGLQGALAWWFLKGGAKEAVWRIIACATMGLAIAPHVPPAGKGILAFLAVSLMLGPLIAGCRSIASHLRAAPHLQRGRQAQAGEGVSRSHLLPVATSVVVASIIAGSCVYVISDRALDRQIVEVRQAFAQQKSQLRKEGQAAIREERRRRRAIRADLARARLRESRARTFALVSKARGEYSAWEDLLVSPAGEDWNGGKILRMINKDLRNIVWARKRIDTPDEGQALRDEIRDWMRGGQESRAAITDGATSIRIDRFVRRYR
jgi:hypothetical protein